MIIHKTVWLLNKPWFLLQWFLFLCRSSNHHKKHRKTSGQWIPMDSPCVFYSGTLWDADTGDDATQKGVANSLGLQVLYRLAPVDLRSISSASDFYDWWMIHSRIFLYTIRGKCSASVKTTSRKAKIANTTGVNVYGTNSHTCFNCGSAPSFDFFQVQCGKANSKPSH